MQSGMQDQLVRELKIQLFINHPNVAKVYGFFDDLLHFYTLMECALDGHLSDHLARKTAPLSEEEAAVLLHQTCSAVAALHTHSVIHRDLKPENLLMHEVLLKRFRELSSFVILGGVSIAVHSCVPLSVGLLSISVLKSWWAMSMIKAWIFGPSGSFFMRCYTAAILLESPVSKNWQIFFHLRSPLAIRR